MTIEHTSAIMAALHSRYIPDPPHITRARRALTSQPEDDAVRLRLGHALASEGCGYEAARILRPLRARWRDEPWAPDADRCLAAMAWWNREWRDFARARHESRVTDALAMVADHAPALWDHPPTLEHIGSLARHVRAWPLAEHAYARIAWLCERGVEKIALEPFRYLAAAHLLEIRAVTGDPQGALSDFRRLEPNPGNRHHHDMLLGDLLILAGEHDQAMTHVAHVLTGVERRSGWGRQQREAWAHSWERLDPLRARDDWAALIDDPKGYAGRAVRR